MRNSTIAAIATPLGYSAIGIVRISGPLTFSVIKKIFQTPVKKLEPFRLYLGKLLEPVQKKLIDQAMVVFIPGPKSYTGQDMAEIFCHGNPLILKKVLQIIFSMGGVPAQRGEFTQRAFLAGKISLLEAEALLNLVQAPSEHLLNNYARQLTGAASELIQNIRQKLIDFLTRVEALIDFPEDVNQLELKNFPQELKKILETLQKTSRHSEKFTKSRGNLRLALVGRTNSGKSTLFNTLAKNDRAIVSYLAGTTRDFLEEDLLIEDALFRVIDTAGFEKRPGFLSRLALKKTEQIIKEAEIIIFLIDGAQKKLLTSEENFFKKLKREKRIFLAVITKKDLISSKIQKRLGSRLKKLGLKPLFVSALYQTGINNLLRQIYRLYRQNYLFLPENELLFNLRQQELLKKALDHLQILAELKLFHHEEIAAQELKQALQNLDEITGQTFSEELLDQIFANFCLGK